MANGYRVGQCRFGGRDGLSEEVTFMLQPEVSRSYPGKVARERIQAERTAYMTLLR